MEQNSNATITVEAIVHASVQQVWRCWTEPEHIKQWNNASDDWWTTRAENDLRVGGKFLSRMEAKDGSFGFDFNGIYDEVRLNQYISYVIEGGRKVNITFEDNQKEVRIIETFEMETENSAELQQKGWQSILDNFKNYVELNFPTSQKIIPNLWFDTQAEEAVNFYLSIFKDARITSISRFESEGAKVSGMPDGSVMTIGFELFGQSFIAMNGGPVFQFTPAISFMVSCESQEEVDSYWDALLEEGEAMPCGWIKDKYGMSWQIIPTALGELMSAPDPVRAQRVMKSMLGMEKIIIEELRQAYDAE